MIYVTDQQANVMVEIEKAQPDSAWRTLSPPFPAGHFLQPAGMVVEADGSLIVADSGHNRLVLLSADRQTASVFAPDGDAIGSLWHPVGITHGDGESLLIADTGNHRIVRCDSVAAPQWSAFGSGGSGVGKFIAPTSLAMNAVGQIVIADPGAGRLVRINAMDARVGRKFLCPHATASHDRTALLEPVMN